MKRSTFSVKKGGKMDIGQLCSELLKNEIDSYVIPTNQASFYLAAGAKAFAKNAPDVLSAIGAAPFNALAATALFFKIAKEIEGEMTADKKLDQLIGSFYKDGLSHLMLAACARSDTTIQGELQEASSKFVTAANTASSPFIIAKARFFAGVCYELSREEAIASSLYKGAYEAGQQEIIKRLARLEARKDAVDRAIDASRDGSRRIILRGRGVVALLRAKLLRRAIDSAMDSQVVEKVAGTVHDFLEEAAERTIDSLKAKEIQEALEFQENFLVPLSKLLSRGGREQIS